MTPKQQLFVDEYLKDRNATAAYKRAGYKGTGRTAANNASRMLGNAGVATAIAARTKEVTERALVDAKWVLIRLMQVADLDPRRAYDDEGTLLPIDKIPEDVRRALGGLEVDEIWEGHGEERTQTGITRKIRWCDKLKALELLGKHLGMFDSDVPGNVPSMIFKCYGFNPFARIDARPDARPPASK